MIYILFILGFFALVFGAEWLVDGASKLAKKFGVSELIVGLTVVAVGTSLPEFIVNMFAISEGADTLAVSNILGSNITNSLLVLGVAAVLTPLAVHRAVVWREVIFGVFASFMLGVLVADKVLGDYGGFVGLSRVDGIILLSYFAIFLYYTFRRTITSKKEEKTAVEKREISKIKLWPILIKVTLGSAFLFLGGKWIVEGAISIAASFGISDALIGLTVVAFGTSLPELAATVSAIKKKKVDIGIGNIVGSNLFNILLVLGVGSTIRPLTVEPQQIFDVLVVILVSLILFVSLTVGRHKHQISRPQGIMFLILYAGYLIFVVTRSLGIF